MVVLAQAQSDMPKRGIKRRRMNCKGSAMWALKKKPPGFASSWGVRGVIISLRGSPISRGNSVSLLTIQHFPNLVGEDTLGEGLFDEIDTFVDDTMVGDDICRVP